MSPELIEGAIAFTKETFMSMNNNIFGEINYQISENKSLFRDKKSQNLSDWLFSEIA